MILHKSMCPWINADLAPNCLVSLESQWPGTLPHLLAVELHENDKQVCEKTNRGLNAETFLGPLGVGPRNLEVGYDEASYLRSVLIGISTKKMVLPVVRAKLIQAATSPLPSG